MLTHTLVLTGDERMVSEVVPIVRDECARFVEGKGAEDLWGHLRRGVFDAVIVDRAFLGPVPTDTVAQIRALPAPPEFLVLIREDETVARAELLASGAMAVLSRETPTEELCTALLALIARAAETARRRTLPSSEVEEVALVEMRTRSPRMSEFLELLRLVATADSSLLFDGETGSGKEYFAKAVHGASARRDGPFVPVHCAALSETLLESELFGHVEGAFTGASRSRRGYFELADGGTVFLDEVGELSTSLQVKLLRVLQERAVQPVGAEKSFRVDVRLMAATNRDLNYEMSVGGFRPDLYYRLSVVSLRVPSLRERVEDIPELAAELLRLNARKMRRPERELSAAASKALAEYAWPGNIRELMNVLERATLLARGDQITPRDLPFSPEASPARFRTARPAGEPFALARERVLAEFEEGYLSDLLKRTRGRVGAAARLADLNERTLYQKMRRHGLRKETYRELT